MSLMQAAIHIPEPTPGDSETVVTALETAALFGAKGDASEALRWLQRAAESAGESGDDARTLALARTAAELSRVIQSPPSARLPSLEAAEDVPPNSARRAPKPPPRPPSPREVSDEAPPSASRPTLVDGPLSGPPRGSGPPPPPSARTIPSSPAASRPSGHSPPISSALESDPTDPDGQRLTQPAPAPLPSRLPGAAEIQRLRQAARVAVVESSEPGLYLMRLLDDGTPAPPHASEGYLVLVDPQSNLFGV